MERSSITPWHIMERQDELGGRKHDWYRERRIEAAAENLVAANQYGWNVPNGADA
jgi:hypothetical protein